MIDLNRKDLIPALRDHEQRWSSCTACNLHKLRSNVVLARGVLPCDFLFIGEAPGQYDDLRGLPFAGPAGQLLDRIINLAVREWEEEYRPTYAFTNLVACVPTHLEIDQGGVRQPTPKECEACRPRLREFINIAQPKGIIVVGDTTSHFGPEDTDLPIAEILHSSYLLRLEDRNRFAPLMLSTASVIYNFITSNWEPHD